MKELTGIPRRTIKADVYYALMMSVLAGGGKVGKDAFWRFDSTRPNLEYPHCIWGHAKAVAGFGAYVSDGSMEERREVEDELRKVALTTSLNDRIVQEHGRVQQDGTKMISWAQYVRWTGLEPDA